MKHLGQRIFKRTRLGLCLFIFMGYTSSLEAALYLIDFGPSSNQTLDAAETWNNFTSVSAATELALVSTLGVSEGVKLASNGSFSILNEVAPVGGTYPYVSSVMNDGFFNPSSRILTFSGLNQEMQYGLKVYGYVNRPDSRLTAVTSNGVTKSYEPGNTRAGNQSGGSVEFLNLTPNASGEVSFTIASGIGNNFILTAAELYSVPEPRIGTLLGLAGLAFVMRRKTRA